MKSVATLATAESGKYKDNYYKSPKVEKNKIKHMLTYVKSKWKHDEFTYLCPKLRAFKIKTVRACYSVLNMELLMNSSSKNFTELPKYYSSL